MTPDAVQEKYGMSAEQYPDFAALRGDPSDNLPSVPGVREKTAAKWVVEYGSLHELIANIDKLGGKVGQSLRDSINDVIRNRELTQLVANVPLELSIDALAWSGVDESNTNPLFEKLEFKTLKDRMKPILLKSTSKAPEPALELFATEIAEGVLSPAEASAKIAQHSGDIAITYQIVDEKLHRYAVALTPDDVFLVHSSEMGDWATNSAISKIAHDAKSLARINGLTGICFDTSLAAYLVNPGVRSQEFKDIQERWGDGSGINQTSPEQELLTSARAMFALKESLTRELKERNLWDLFTTMELPVADLLGRMEAVGVAVNKKGLEQLAAFFEGEVSRETKAAHDAVGHEFNVASPKQLQVVLFDELNLPKTKKIKTGYTTDAESLDWLHQKSGHPVLTSLLRIRETKKLGTTVEGLIAEIAKDGRIHTHFQQTVAATGRLSSTGPNLQNIPVRTEEGRKIRDCFTVGKGYVALLTADYSQIEMRIMAHLSHDEKLLAAFVSKLICL
jgi:DNA polymerase-1